MFFYLFSSSVFRKKIFYIVFSFLLHFKRQCLNNVLFIFNLHINLYLKRIYIFNATIKLVTSQFKSNKNFLSVAYIFCTNLLMSVATGGEGAKRLASSGARSHGFNLSHIP